jgi:streptolysin S family bacteriocin protoxin
MVQSCCLLLIMLDGRTGCGLLRVVVVVVARRGVSRLGVAGEGGGGCCCCNCCCCWSWYRLERVVGDGD